MAENGPEKLTPRQIDEKCRKDGIPLRHAGWDDLPDPTANGVWPLGLAVLFYAWRDLAHTREQGERLRVWGRDLWRDPTDERQYMALGHAEAFLRGDLASGIVRAFGHKIGANGPEHARRPIPPEAWDEIALGIRFDISVVGSAQRVLYNGVTVLRHEVVPLLISEIRSATMEPEMRNRPGEPAPRKMGAALKHDWPAAAGFAAAYGMHYDYPKVKDEFATRMRSWFGTQGKVPDRRDLDRFVTALYDALDRKPDK